MTYPDDNRYPPPAWPPPPSGPHGHARQQESYGRDPWQSYGHDSAPRSGSHGHDVPTYAAYDSYGSYDSFGPYDSYGQAPRNAPQAPETQRHGGDLDALRSAYRVLRRVSTLTALGSFVMYVVLSCCAPELMGSKVTGELSLGMALGIIQLVVTFAAVLWYSRSAERSVDPLARFVRERAVRPGRDAGVAR